LHPLVVVRDVCALDFCALNFQRIPLHSRSSALVLSR
jgi:hypothetical protein